MAQKYLTSSTKKVTYVTILDFQKSFWAKTDEVDLILLGLSPNAITELVYRLVFFVFTLRTMPFQETQVVYKLAGLVYHLSD